MTDVGIYTLFRNDKMALPKYAHEGDAGCDVQWNGERGQKISLAPGMRHLFKTGIFVRLPAGMELQVRPRSGWALDEGITVLNAPGTIDERYHKQIGVILINHGSYTVDVEAGDKIAQIVLKPVYRINWLTMNARGESDRGAYGSSGK